MNEVTLKALIDLIDQIVGSTGYELDADQQELLNNAYALEQKGFEVK